MAPNGHKNGSTTPEIILYTNRVCPWAHRAHTVLAELGLPFKEVTIDLDTPREAWYLKINPRGLVPAISYNGDIITESAIVAQFLADAHPSHLEKASNEPGGALQRARINFFVDAATGKVNPLLNQAARTLDEQERADASAKLVDTIVKELEPLLVTAQPYFGGSDKLTLAEIQTGSLVLRWLEYPKYGLLTPNVLSDLENRAPNFYKWGTKVIAHPSVNGIWNAEVVTNRAKAKAIKNAKAAAATK